MDRLPLKDEQGYIVDGIRLRRPSDDGIKQWQQSIDRQAVGTNYGVDPGRFIPKGSVIAPFDNRLNVAGFVENDNPSVIRIRAPQEVVPEQRQFEGYSELANSMLKAVLAKKDVNTLAHEAAHSGQMMNKTIPATLNDAQGSALRNLFRNYMRATATKQQNIGGYYNPMQGSIRGTQLSNGVDDAHELGGYLAGIDAINPSGIDPKTGKPRYVPFENTAAGREIVPRNTDGFSNFLKSSFNIDTGASPVAVEMLKALMGRGRLQQ
jgi:hypothetical protein